MEIINDFSLKTLNTFGIEAEAERFAVARNLEELRKLIQLQSSPVRVLGGGSNVLLTGNLPGLTIKNEIGGIEIESENADEAVVTVGGGVIWHELVLWAIEQGLGGIENLSLIPGTVGAAPIQNIGAYGVELKDVFHSLEAVDLKSGELSSFNSKDCQFGYRDSIFKRTLKGKMCIVKVRLRLSKTPQLNTGYGDIQRMLLDWGIEQPTLREVSRAVIHIRQSKLPDPAEIGNAGSFFKNPEIEQADYQAFASRFPEAPHYDLPDGKVKIPAGWLIEQAGWKGKRFDDAGCHTRQALVLVNYGGASGADLLGLAKQIQTDVLGKYGIEITPEVNVW